MAKEPSIGQMEVYTREIYRRTCWKDTGNTTGLTAENSKATGKTTKFMEAASLYGQTVEDMMENMSTTRSMDMVYSTSKTAGNLRETGNMAGWTDKESLKREMEGRELAYGTKARF